MDFYFVLMLLLLLGFLALVAILFRSWRTLAPWMPTRRADLEQIHELTNLEPGETFLEFGCGTAHVSRYIARKNPEARIIGIEYVAPFFLYSRAKQKLLGPKNLEIIFGNGFAYPLDDVDVLYTFAMPRTLEKRMKGKVLGELKSGATFISYVFGLDDREGGHTAEHRSRSGLGAMYVYTKK